MQENLRLKQIKPSQLLVGYLILFIPKKMESLDYALTIDSWITLQKRIDTLYL